jgi:hypothetical protein
MSAVVELDRTATYRALWKYGANGDARHLYAGYTRCCICGEQGYNYGTSPAGRCCLACFISNNCKHPRR